jgi:hypothetical protein
MADDEFKLDVRVRERLMRSGVLKESEVARHLEGLTDVENQAVPVVAKQPALQSESDRDIVIVRTSGVRPPPTPPRHDDDLESTPLEDEDDDDLDDDDDDDDDDEGDAPAKKPEAEKPVEAAKPAPAPPEESDDEDEDEDEKKDKEGEKVDDDWGGETT